MVYDISTVGYMVEDISMVFLLNGIPIWWRIFQW